MSALERFERRDQMLKVRANDPLQVVALYRRAVGLNRASMLPGGMDFTSLIDSILDHEASTGRRFELPAI
jgi:hypothetical protein